MKPTCWRANARTHQRRFSAMNTPLFRRMEKFMTQSLK